MIWLIEIALILLLFGGGLTMLTRGRHSDKREALIMRRVDAYIETIRRERRNPDLAAMSDTELRDLLHSGASNMRVVEQKKGWIVLGIGAATVITASLVGSEQGFLWFSGVAAVGAIVAYGTHQFMTRQARAPLERHGIDVERLMVK